MSIIVTERSLSDPSLRLRSLRQLLKDACEEIQNIESTEKSKATAQVSLSPAAKLSKIHASRLRRKNYFGAGLFSDPAWDILLSVYVAHLQEVEISVSSACFASGAPPTTALRWIKALEERVLIKRQNDFTDRRRIFLSLTARGIEAMERFLTSECPHL